MPDHIVRKKLYSPAAVGVGETVSLFEVPKGYRVKSSSGSVQVAAESGTSSTLTLGDGSDPDGYVTTANLDLETTGMFDGTGAYLADAGKLYAAKDTIDAVYTPGGTPGAVVPRVEFRVVLFPEWAVQ